ncbi:sugar ABC transporter permease [Microbacterium sp. VKM Ac-2870]|uniref:carbohydrate ABC transporter permease n=1 Tax=Microbacterium sp. VKM Ac-2870 TaxID=2783825 RepID=UPI00188A9A16|nr:sugar ABC transporter permease [Microbacterium sp. VKM Ac-2870]MBF4562169.1 sugar ABC transporter permease [Microbacterium sp. VKM Ac-2870]
MSALTVTAPARRRAHRTDRQWAGFWFVLPFLVVFALTFLAPLAYSIYLSVFRTKLIGGTSFVGIDNYVQAFSDGQFWAGFGNVFLVLIIQVPIMLLLALLAALALDSRRLAGSSIFRIGIFLPYAVPGVVAVLMWGFMYSDRLGLAGNINQLVGFDLVTPFTQQWILLAIGNIITWEFIGYNMLIFYSALRTIPEDLYEAAALDGAGQFRIIRAIKLPALRGALVIATIFSIIGSFQLFNEPNILKTLVPNLLTTYFTPNMYAYNLSFIGQQVNYAATIAIIMGVITAIIAYVVQLRGTRKENR